MSTVSEPSKGLTRRERILELAAYLGRHNSRFMVMLRPFCPEHPDTLMYSNSGDRGQTYFYCPEDGCDYSIKLKTKRIV